MSNLHSIRIRAVAFAGSAAGLLLLTGCHMDMWLQPKAKPLQPSDVFTDGSSMRPLVPHSVDRTHFWTDIPRYTGWDGKKLVNVLPFTITRADLDRGQERFNIYCSPCHGVLGDGQGMIAQRGMTLRRQPASYHTDRLRKMPIGHFYDVITNGYGIMYSYASRVEPDDRWRIAAYIRVLQRSRNAKISDLPDSLDPQLRQSLINSAPPPTPPSTGAGTQTAPPAPETNSDQNPKGNGTNANGH